MQKAKGRANSREWGAGTQDESDSGLLTSHGHRQVAGPPPAEGSRAHGEEPLPRLAGKPGEQVCLSLLPGALSVT